MRGLLSSSIVDELHMSKEIRVLEGDVTSENFGLDEETLLDLRSKVSIYIRSAASLSFKAGLQEMTSIIVDPSLVAAKMALYFVCLERFVYVSTAYANAYLHWLPVKDNVRHDC